jgi:putative DNA primase/helicase
VSARGRRPAASPQLLGIDPSAPYDIAQLFLRTEFTEGAHRTMHHHRGAFYGWNGTNYPEIEKADVRARIYAFLDRCEAIGRTTEKVKPNPGLVSSVLDGLEARAHLRSAISAPVWLDNRSDFATSDILACANGLLHLPSLNLLPHTPMFFAHNAIDFAFDRDVSAPRHWLKFLDDLWPDDAEAIETLQEIFGYCLTGDTSQQKMFLVVGPPRGGKGTIARVLERVVGLENKVNPSLAELGRQFGIAPLIGKRVAIISDARLRGVGQVIEERLLSITGEDAITIDRKYLSAWTGRLQIRFVVLSNELPRLPDPSGALARRFIILKLRNSFYGKEDHGLIYRLLLELPGILNWAIAGWRRLNQRGHFQMPKSVAETVQQLEDLGSPIRAFVREQCIVEPGQTVDILAVFGAWRTWCLRRNREPGTEELFGRDLRAAVPGLTVSQPRTETGGRRRLYNGIGLNPARPG